MRTLAALLLAALPAAAQVRVGAVQGGTIRPAAASQGGAGLGVHAAALSPLTASPLTGALPALTVPSAAPSPLAAASPLLAPSLAVAAARVPAPSKASDRFREESARTIAEWKASREGKPASPRAPAAAPAPVHDAGALFDGRLPKAREALARAPSLGMAELGAAIASSRDLDEAASRLAALGLLTRAEAAAAREDEDGLRILLGRLWRASAPAVPAPFPVDRSAEVPALRVEKDGVTYFVHGVAHGQLGAPDARAVRALARRAAAEGGFLYSEQNLPAHYGYAVGLETLDHEARRGVPLALRPAANGAAPAALLARRALNALVSPGSALAAAAWAVLDPASPWAWGLLAAALYLAWLTLTGSLPRLARQHRREAAALRAEGDEDLAAQMDDEAAHFFKSRPDLEVLRSLELPQPLGGEDAPVSARSRAIAAAVAADAAARGAATARVIVGHLHAHEVAWRLAHPEDRRA